MTNILSTGMRLHTKQFYKLHKNLTLLDIGTFPIFGVKIHKSTQMFCSSLSFKGCITINKERCIFPFIYKGKKYTSCTKDSWFTKWCSTEIKPDGTYKMGHWGSCDMKTCKRESPGKIRPSNCSAPITLNIPGVITFFALPRSP